MIQKINKIDFLDINNLVNSLMSSTTPNQLHFTSNLFSKPSGIAYLSSIIQKNNNRVHIDFENSNC
ncbi:MAG: hypothetical protein JXQ76_05335, partial [Campylobacterales bacterium]|nr:hypothetical protein [Campylobacterales bacterium]